MCGITGFWHIAGHQPAERMERLVAAMADSLAHRGPDDRGIWIDPDAAMAFGHRRLSIIDLSPAGHQPMISADGRFVMIYNGEVYSHEEIRPELEARGIMFRGRSDTEVILESFAAFGIEATLPRLIGMFAIALWDRRDRRLTLIRDRLGIKPLYWTLNDGVLIFGSELKALRAHPGFTPRIDRAATTSFLRHSYVPAPYTIYQNVQKLEPGCILTLASDGQPRIARFWDARDVARKARSHPLHGSDNDLIDQLEDLLEDAVGRRMIADVPLGAFLSGGIDSSTIAALMQKKNSGVVKTFSIGFDIAGFDESQHASAVARHLGTEHTELTVTAREALDTIPKLPDWYDEPFADSSQIPTCLVSAMTRRHVTVALSGDGGDELFAGYNRYMWATKIQRTLSLLPQPLRGMTAAAITAISPDRWSKFVSALPGHLRFPQAGDKLHKIANLLDAENADGLYRKLISHWEPSRIAPGAGEIRGILFDDSVRKDFPDLLDRMQFLDLVTYLPDDILTKIDRASMAASLEARVPLLDHRVVEFAWRLPQAAKIRNGRSKWLLRQVLYRHVPRELIERPKMGFTVPLGEWLRGPLRDWAESLLDEQRLREAGLVDAAIVRRYWQEHLAGTRNRQYPLWDVLMLEDWRARWG